MKDDKNQEVDFSKFGPRMGPFLKWCDKFLGAPKTERGKAQDKAFQAYGSFVTSVAGIAIVIGMVAAFGFWALAVILIIMGLSMVSGSGGGQ